MLVCALVDLVIMVPIGLFVWTMVVIRDVCCIVVMDVFEHPFSKTNVDRIAAKQDCSNYLLIKCYFKIT